MSCSVDLPEDLIPIVASYHPLFCDYQRIYQIHTYHNGQLHSIHGITREMYHRLAKSLSPCETSEIQYHHRSPFDSTSKIHRPFIYHVVHRYQETNIDSDSEPTVTGELVIDS